jgi:hypothetical protein
MTTVKDYILRMQAVKQYLADQKTVTENIALVAGKQLEAEMGRRIFLKGRDTAGAAIGTYSVTPFYINPNAPLFKLLPKFKKSKPRLTPVGAKGQTVFKNGKPHKTAYIGGGYAEFRKIVGRQPGAKLAKLGGITANGVNLNLTGSMAQNFGLGFSGRRIAMGFTSLLEYAKARGNEERFGVIGSIFSASKSEKANFIRSSNREFLRLVTLAYNKASK